MAEAFFETNFHSSLRESADPRHRGLFSTLRDELPASVISEAQMSIPSVFHKPAKFVYDALRWLTARGKNIHIASISKTLTPYGMLLTASADIQMDTEKTSLDYVLVAITSHGITSASLQCRAAANGNTTTHQSMGSRILCNCEQRHQKFLAETPQTARCGYEYSLSSSD